MKRYILPIVILIALSTTANAHTFRDRIRARFSRPTVEVTVTETVTETFEVISPEPVVTSSKRVMRFRRMPMRSGLAGFRALWGQ